MQTESIKQPMNNCVKVFKGHLSLEPKTTLDEIFKNFSPNEKVVVYVDGANQFHSCKESDIIIDYKEFREVLSQYMIVRALNYFVAVTDNKKISSKLLQSNKTINFLENNGWRIYKKIADTGVDKDTGRAYIRKGNVDTDLAATMVDELHCANGNLDHVILVTGDKDYEQAVKILRRSVRVTVISTKQHLSSELRLAADDVIYFDDLKPFIDFRLKSKTLNEEANDAGVITNL